MKIFLIEDETNNITAYTFAKDAEAVQGAKRFRNQAGLAKLAAKWPLSRLVDIWNSLPGEVRVKKFKDRATAAARIWKAIEHLGETVAAIHEGQENTPRLEATAANTPPQTRHVAPASRVLGKKASKAKKPPQSAVAAREGSKTETVLTLLKRAGGVTSAELMSATGWQPHSVRGFLSGTVRKKMGLKLVSDKAASGERSYAVEG